MCTLTVYYAPYSSHPLLFLSHSIFLKSHVPPPAFMVNVLVQTHAYVTKDGKDSTAVCPFARVVVPRMSIVLVPISASAGMVTLVAPVSFAWDALLS